MKPIALLAAIFPPIVLVLASCASASSSDANNDTFSTQPDQTVMSRSGQIEVEVRIAPDPPEHGLCQVELRLANARTGTPVTADISVTPWMPAHNHGASVIPTVTPTGAGRYRVTNLDLFMPGTWQLRTTLAGGTTDQVTPTFDVR